MVISILIAAAIALYAGWVIRKKVRDFRRGKFCDCGCGSCDCGCGKKERHVD